MTFYDSVENLKKKQMCHVVQREAARFDTDFYHYTNDNRQWTFFCP